VGCYRVINMLCAVLRRPALWRTNPAAVKRGPRQGA
jgi:hypothetical protein